MSDPFIGEIRLFTGNFAPLGWALCNGATLQIRQNTALYAIIGNMYGGDGQNTFNLPDFRDRAAIGYGAGPNLTVRTWGDKGGASTVQLTSANLPAHTHLPNCQSSADSNSPNGAIWANTGRGGSSVYNNLPGIGMSTETLKEAGGTVSHNNVQPTLSFNFIIATQGIFPARD